MRYSLHFLVGITVLGLASPAGAQDGTLSVAAFMTVRDENVTDLEEGILEHNRWHQEQGDPWTWDVWQAMTGTPEYAYISGGHDWADLDDPGIDLSQDHHNWAETGGRYTESMTSSMWQGLPDASMPGDPDEPFNIAQVIEFSVNPGGDEAFAHVLAKYHDAAEAVAPNANYTWTSVVAGPQGTTHFVVIPATSFADFGMDTPEPPEILARHYGMTEARELGEMFVGAMTFRQTRIWVRRPDLSFGPN